AALVEEAARETLQPPASAQGRPRPWLLAGAGIAAAAVVMIAAAALWPRADVPTDAAALAGGTALDGQVASTTQAGTVAQGSDGSIVAAPLADGDNVGPSPAITADAAGLASRIGAASSGSARDGAWQALLAAWDLPHTAEDARAASGCAAMLAPGTYCVSATAHLDRLAAIGRPALLQLESDGGQAWALLQGSDGHRARL